MIAASLILGQVEHVPITASKPKTLHEKVAAALGWPMEETQRFSLQSLRELVRVDSPALAEELTTHIQSGTCAIQHGKPILANKESLHLLPLHLHAPDCTCNACTNSKPASLAVPATSLGPYESCRAEAQRLANELGFDYGVEKDAFGYHHFMLPQRQNRYGHELSCEVVSCEILANCKPGHGPR